MALLPTNLSLHRTSLLPLVLKIAWHSLHSATNTNRPLVKIENSTLDSHFRSDNSATYESPYPLYAMAFSSITSRTPHHQIALGSFIEEYNNRVDIVSFDEETLTIKPNPNLSFDHPYPPIESISVLNNNKTSEFCAPLTLFDWNERNFYKLRTLLYKHSYKTTRLLTNEKAGSFYRERA
ncbi:hypothetical protein LguiB_017234 [Lonicera macranthoides]